MAFVYGCVHGFIRNFATRKLKQAGRFSIREFHLIYYYMRVEG